MAHRCTHHHRNHGHPYDDNHYNNISNGSLLLLFYFFLFRMENEENRSRSLLILLLFFELKALHSAIHIHVLNLGSSNYIFCILSHILFFSRSQLNVNESSIVPFSFLFFFLFSPILLFFSLSIMLTNSESLTFI